MLIKSAAVQGSLHSHRSKPAAELSNAAATARVSSATRVGLLAPGGPASLPPLDEVHSQYSFYTGKKLLFKLCQNLVEEGLATIRSWDKSKANPLAFVVVLEELESNRERQLELREQIEKLQTMLENSQEAISFSKPHFQSAVSCALQILGAEPLKLVESSDGMVQCQFPALDKRPGADPSWAETMDSLRAPRGKDQKFWEWRKSSPIRSVVFEDPGKVTEEVVQLHLEQKVVTRLLSRFTAQGFVHFDLSRTCLAQSTDMVPRVLLLGRLALYGAGAARLHEEIIPITARWTDPAIRKGDLSPYAREAEARTMNLLDAALVDKHPVQLPDVIVRQLQAAAAEDVKQLLPHLEARAEEFANDAVEKLAERADAESKAMREILENQQKHLLATVARHERNPQLTLEFNQEEKRQLESNQRYWTKRLIALDEELKSEPERIRRIYDVMARRVEPVGLVYLWPVAR